MRSRVRGSTEDGDVEGFPEDGRGHVGQRRVVFKARPNLQDREPPSMMPAHRPEVGVGPISTER